MNKYLLHTVSILLAGAVLTSCSSSGRQAPLVERGAAKKITASSAQRPQDNQQQDNRPQVYVIAKGDTLYSLAFNYGLDYREVAELNNIQNPDVIHVGQEIRLLPNDAATTTKSLPETKRAPEPKAVSEIKAQTGEIKEWPRAVKLNYSVQAIAQIKKLQAEISQSAPAIVVKAEDKTNSTANESDGELAWGMPTAGKIVGEFSENANRKGIDIAGKLGQNVLASAAGKVVYSGSGLRGYGKLLIIKHNKTYLSAYAHNDQILVKEGQSVSKGQHIAAMGNTDADQVKLHFEIRKFGQPVDPAKYLPL